MRNYLDAIANFLMERNAEELIVGVFLALLLAISSAGLHSLVRDRVKDGLMLLTVVGLVANVVAMVLTAGYLRMNFDRSNFDRASAPVGPRPRPSPSQARDIPLDAAIRAIFETADVDHDGRLSAEEAAIASARFVKRAEIDAGNPLDKGALGLSIQQRLSEYGSRRQAGWSDRAPGGRGGLPRSSSDPGPPTSDAIPLGK